MRGRPARRSFIVALGAVEVTVEGSVQGVGYRAFAQRRAQHWGLTGYAANVRGGEVRIRAEGERDAIEKFLRDLEAGPPLAQVHRVSVSPVSYSGRYRDFDVRFSEAGPRPS